jgi:hypothetical protein
LPETTASKAKPEKRKRAPRRDFEKVYPPAHSIHIVTAVNPKRPGTKSHNLFDLYYICGTVENFLKAGGTYRQLDYDVQHKFIRVSP